MPGSEIIAVVAATMIFARQQFKHNSNATKKAGRSIAAGSWQ